VVVGEGFDFAGVGVLGGVDLVQSLVQPGGFFLAAGVAGGGGGGELVGEQGGALGAEDPLGVELADGLDQEFFTYGDDAGVVGAGVAGRHS